MRARFQRPNDSSQATSAGASNHPDRWTQLQQVRPKSGAGTLSARHQQRDTASTRLKPEYAGNRVDHGPTAKWNATSGLAAAARNPVANDLASARLSSRCVAFESRRQHFRSTLARRSTRSATTCRSRPTWRDATT